MTMKRSCAALAAAQFLALSPAAPAQQAAGQHPALLIASYSNNAAYIVAAGDDKVVWESPKMPGPCQDAWLLPNNHILLSGGNQVREVSADHKIVWQYEAPKGVAVDANGNVFVSDQSYLWEIQGAGGDAVILGNVQSPEGMVADSRGNVFVANGAAKVIDKLNLITAKFGAVNVGSTGSAVTLTFTFIHGGAISAPMVVTKGAVDLDFVDAGTGTCTTNNGSDKIYETGETCTVDVTLEPTVSGVRVGAVELLDIDGNVISTAYLQGTGVGPQVAFSPATRSMVATGLGSPSAVAVDGDGNIFATQAFSSVKKFAPGGAVTTLTGVPGSADGVAVDGAGNLFVALPNSKAVY